MKTKTFKYEAITKEGKKLSGEMEAQDLTEVKKMLRREGARATKIQAPTLLDIDLNEFLLSLMGAKTYGQKDLARFMGQLATLIDAGVPILQSLEILYKQEKSPGLKKAVKSVAKYVNEGKSLQDAMTLTGAFDRLICYMVKAGETAGILDTVLVRLTTFLEKKEAIKKKVKGALTYPAILVVVGIGVLMFLLTFVIPQFVDMITGSGQKVPWITQMVMDLSDFFQKYFMGMFVVMAGFVIGLIAYIKTVKCKENFDRTMLQLPLFKDLAIKSNLATFTQTLSTLISSGIPILDALDICAETMDNRIIAADIAKVRNSVAGGKTITEPLKRIAYFPPLVAQMIEVGEGTGKLDTMLEKVAKIFEIEVEGAIQMLTTLIEPIILVILGGAIAAVMVAMYLPIFMSAGTGGG